VELNAAQLVARLAAATPLAAKLIAELAARDFFESISAKFVKTLQQKKKN